MENAATRLARILEEWRTVPNGQTFWKARARGVDRQSMDFWKIQIEAAILLDQIARELDALRAMGTPRPHFERAFPGWAEAVWAPSEVWGQNSGDRTVITQESVDLLAGLGDYLSATTPAVALDAQRKTTVTGALDEILALLATGDARLGESEQRYVVELVNHLRVIVAEADVVGTIDLLRRVHELVGFLTLLADQLEGDGADPSFISKLRNATRRVVPYTAVALQFAAGAVGVYADFKQITGM